MNRSTLLLLVAFVVLAGFTGWYFTKGKFGTSLGGNDYKFAVEDTASITKIFLADRLGNKITLRRQEGYWTVNDDKKVRPTAIDNLLQTIHKVQLKYRAPRAAIPNLVRDLMTHGIKVEIYGKKDKLLKSYYVGGSTSDEMGTHMIMDGSDEPYVTHLPAFDGALRIRYMMKELDWRDRTIVAAKIEDIESVTVDYPKLQSKSFRLDKKPDGEYDIKPFYPGTQPPAAPYRKGSAEQYLRGFEKQAAEAFENENIHRDSVSRLMPFAIVSVTEKGGRKTTVRLHPIVSQNKHGEFILDSEGNKQIERYFADVSTGDFMLVQHLLWAKVLAPIDFFYQEPSGTAVRQELKK